MTQFESAPVRVNAPCSKVYDYLSDFRNLKHLMPEQVINWQATETSCSFTIKGMADLSMRIDSKAAGRNIHIVADGKNPIEYTMDYFFTGKDNESCQVTVMLEAALNPFLKSIASRPLQNFVEMIAGKLPDLFRNA